MAWDSVKESPARRGTSDDLVFSIGAVEVPKRVLDLIDRSVTKYMTFFNVGFNYKNAL